jgi:tRNA (guanine37-N1)-methyltransferase
LRKRLQSRLTSQDAIKIYNSYDVVGDIAIIKVPNDNVENAKKAAAAVMAVYKNLKAVFVQVNAIQGEFRVRQLIHVGGENKTSTLHRESGCGFKVDVEKCYFSPRLSLERRRISELVKGEETVVNMFAGVGCFSIIIAKKASTAKVYSIDINPNAVECMLENVRINRVYNRVFPLLGDSKEIVNSKLQHKADRVLMPLPEKALQYLPTALGALKPNGGWIHYYDFEHAARNEDPIEKTRQKVSAKLDALGVTYDVSFSRVIRSTGPNWYQTVLDLQIKA